jgi:fumarate reductase subunit C
MSRHRSTGKTCVRPMAGWWRRNPYFGRYMLREASALALTAYALVLLAGLASLARGEAAFEAWRAMLATPLSIGLHALALPLLAYHSLTWFQVMPKTAPRLPVAPGLITAGGLAASAVLSLLILTLIGWAGR